MVLNTTCALALAVRILARAAKLGTVGRDIEKGGFRRTPGWWACLGGRELFPLSFSVALVVHGLILLVVEGMGIKAGYGENACGIMAGIAWTGEFRIWRPRGS